MSLLKQVNDKLLDKIRQLDFVESATKTDLLKLPKAKFRIDVILKNLETLSNKLRMLIECIPEYSFSRRFILNKNHLVMELIVVDKEEAKNTDKREVSNV